MGNSGDTEVTGVSRYKMQRAVDYIRQNYGKPIDMAEAVSYTHLLSLILKILRPLFSLFIVSRSLGCSNR